MAGLVPNRSPISLAIATTALAMGIGWFEPSRADVIELRDGGVLVGKVLNPQGGLTVTIEIEDGATVELDRKLVRIRPTMERDRTYVDKIQSRGDTLEDHRAIVAECVSEGMQTMANAHRERIVELDPDDRSSWDHLKYFRDESTGKWLRREVVMYRRGKIKGDRGRWYTWQEKALMDLDRRYTEERVAAEKELQQRLKGLEGNNRQQAEALEYFRTLDNPLLAGKLLSLYGEARTPSTRVFFMNLLKQLPATAAAPALIKIAMEDRDLAMVDASLTFLESSDSVVREMAMANFASGLQNKRTRDRAAYCMGPFEDDRFLTMLIGSLLSTDLVVPSGPPGSTTAGVSTDGGIGFSSGSPKPQQRLNQHKDVLSTLSRWTGENFGYDIAAWQQWYARTHAYENMDLRRDDF